MARGRKPVVEALDAYLDELKPAGAAAVRAELARRLAEAAESAPEYALARIADSLEDLLEKLAGDSPSIAEQVVESLAWLRAGDGRAA